MNTLFALVVLVCNPNACTLDKVQSLTASKTFKTEEACANEYLTGAVPYISSKGLKMVGGTCVPIEVPGTGVDV